MSLRARWSRMVIIGGKSGRSMWWGLLVLPYAVGWLMALVDGVVGLVRFFRARAGSAQA